MNQFHAASDGNTFQLVLASRQGSVEFLRHTALEKNSDATASFCAADHGDKCFSPKLRQTSLLRHMPEVGVRDVRA